MHPVLPDHWESRALRMAMSEEDWQRLDALIQRIAPHESTRARAIGAVLTYLMDREASSEPEAEPLDWLDWERRKTLQTLRLLRPGA